ETHFTRLPIEAHRSPADFSELGIEQLRIALVMDDHRRRVANRFDQFENRDQRTRRLKPAHVDVNAIRRDQRLAWASGPSTSRAFMTFSFLARVKIGLQVRILPELRLGRPAWLSFPTLALR